MSTKIRFARRYICYLLKAKHYNGHGIHSPFIYDFVTKVLFKKDSKEKYSFVENYQKELKRSSQIIDFQDFGAGSKVLTSSKRKISNIVAFSSTKRKHGKLLARMVGYYKPKLILEFGSSLGIGSLYLAQYMNEKAKLITLEGDKAVAGIAKKKFNSITNKNIQLINARFEMAIPQLIEENAYFDFVFFDGNHTKHATINYFEQCLTKINSQSIFVFDDIHWSGKMEEAWDYIQSHPKTKVCIDLFQFGIVFFHKELAKQNYIIRF